MTNPPNVLPVINPPLEAATALPAASPAATEPRSSFGGAEALATCELSVIVVCLRISARIFRA